MNDTTPIEMPGFAGAMVGRLGPMMVVEGRLTGTISSHAATGEELAVVLSGRIEIVLDSQSRMLGPGDYVLVPADMLHEVRAIEDARLLLVAMG